MNKFSNLPEEHTAGASDYVCAVYREDGRNSDSGDLEEDGTLEFLVTAEETDYLFDEIGSVLKIKQYQMEKRDLLKPLEMYYRVFYLGRRD